MRIGHVTLAGLYSMIILFLVGLLTPAYGYWTINDVTDADIKWLYDNGLTQYTTRETFRINDTITREQAAKFFSAFATNVMKKSKDATKQCDFTDLVQADSTLVSAIIESCQLGIFKGYNGAFSPKRNLTAEETVAVLMRIVFGMSSEISNPDKGFYRHTNYFKKAAILGLIPKAGFSYGQPISRGLAAKMIYLARSGTFEEIVKHIPKYDDNGVVTYKNYFSFNSIADIKQNGGTPFWEFYETDENVYMVVSTDMPGGTLITQSINGDNWIFVTQRVLQYNKSSGKISILDTAGQEVRDINDTHMIYYEGYCYEGCFYLQYKVKNLATGKIINIPTEQNQYSAENVRFSDDGKQLLYDERKWNWVATSESCSKEEENQIVGLIAICRGGIVYAESKSSITPKSLPLP